MSYLDFDEFNSQVIITGDIVTQSNLHIGSADEDEGSENRVLRMRTDSKEVPFIPGSSLKGVFRSELERFYIDDDICAPPNVCGKIYAEEKDMDREDIPFCFVCGLFGSMGLAGHVRIDDALPIDSISTMTKPSVAINRVLGTSANKFDFEVVTPRQRFNFHMIIDNIPLFFEEESETPRIKGLKHILRQLMEGRIAIGGKTSAGLGRIKLEDVTVEIIKPEGKYDFSHTDYNLEETSGQFKLSEVES